MIERLTSYLARTGRQTVRLSIKNYRRLLDELYTRGIEFSVCEDSPSELNLAFIKVDRFTSVS